MPCFRLIVFLAGGAAIKIESDAFAGVEKSGRAHIDGSMAFEFNNIIAGDASDRDGSADAK